MANTDFTKTSDQVEREISKLIDSIDRSLDSSSGESERKGQLVLSGFMSLIVFVGIFVFQHVVGKGEVARPSSPSLAVGNVNLPPRDKALVAGYLSRIGANVDTVAKVKTQVIPALPIDGNLAAVRDAVTDIRGVLEISEAPTVEVPARTQP